MKTSNFDKLMDRYLSGKVTESERKKVEAWLEVMKAERDTDLELSAEAEERLFQKITSAKEDVKDVVALYPKKPLAKLFAKQWVRVAASVVVLLSISFTVWNLMDTDQVNEIAAGGKEKLILNDGTLVWLEPGSKFSYYQKENGIRQAHLTGEAFFEVAKIPNSTFTITYGEISVKVLGTSFNLKTEAETIELKVLTGKVNLSSTKDTAGINVTPNERVVYASNGEVERTTLQGSEVTEITSDTEYNMLFENTTMDNVIERIEKKFDVKIKVTEKQLLACHVKVDLTDSSLENTLTTLTHVLDVTYTIDKKKVVLSGKGCD